MSFFTTFDYLDPDDDSDPERFAASQLQGKDTGPGNTHCWAVKATVIDLAKIYTNF